MGPVLSASIILSAFILDILLGDPRWLPHPVQGMGWLIGNLEALLRRLAKTPKTEKIAGGILVILVVVSVSVISAFTLDLSFRFSPLFGFAVSVFMVYTTLAVRGLGDAARSVLKQLVAGDIIRARKELSMIVGRDTGHLDEPEISRAAVETVAENASDGVVAPLFYLALGGPALALAHKAVNTLDSMIGYKNERYRNFGWAAARLDDAANFIPARLTAVFICLASGILRWLKPRIKNGAGSAASPSPQPSPPRGEGDSAIRTPDKVIRGQAPHSGFQSPWRVMLRDHANHPSPNSGWPEAATAGALGVRLGGPSSYGGTISPKPFIGGELRPPNKKDIALSVRLLYCSSLLAVIAASLGAVVLRGWWVTFN